MERKKRIGFYNLVLTLFILAAAASGGKIVSRFAAGQRNEAVMEAVAAGLNNRTADLRIRLESAPDQGADGGEYEPEENGKESEGPAETLTPDEAIRLREERLTQYRALAEKNRDLIGWVSIPGTRIDYPVMQTKDNPDYYLKHNFEKEKSSFGVPYAAEDCDLGKYSGNMILYGHHMKDGSMFAPLSHYTEEAFFREHPWFWFDTEEEAGLYQVIGICKASAAGEDGLFEMARISNEQEYENYVREVKRRSFYDTGITAEWGEPLVTLMTCEYTTREGRLFVVGRKYLSE